jgi:hypothetical protein
LNWKKEKYLEAYELRYVDANAEKMEHNKKKKELIIFWENFRRA